MGIESCERTSASKWNETRRAQTHDDSFNVLGRSSSDVEESERSVGDDLKEEREKRAQPFESNPRRVQEEKAKRRRAHKDDSATVDLRKRSPYQRTSSKSKHV